MRSTGELNNNYLRQWAEEFGVHEFLIYGHIYNNTTIDENRVPVYGWRLEKGGVIHCFQPELVCKRAVQKRFILPNRVYRVVDKDAIMDQIRRKIKESRFDKREATTGN